MRSTKTRPLNLATGLPYANSLKATVKSPCAVVILRSALAPDPATSTIRPLATTLLTPRVETCVPPLKRRIGCVFKCQVEPTMASAPSKRHGASDAMLAPCAAMVPSHLTDSVSPTPNRIRTVTWACAPQAANSTNKEAMKRSIFIISLLQVMWGGSPGLRGTPGPALRAQDHVRAGRRRRQPAGLDGKPKWHWAC